MTRIEETEEPEYYYVSNYSEVFNQIKQLSAFNLQKDDVDGYNLLKTADIYFKKKCSMFKQSIEPKTNSYCSIFLILIHILF